MLMRLRKALPVHPFTGQTAIGVIAGRPIWPIAGAAEDGDGDGDGDDSEDAEDGDGDGDGDDSEDAEDGDGDDKAKPKPKAGDDKPLGPKGEKAFRETQDKLRKSRAELRKLREAAGGLTAEQIKALREGKPADKDGDKPDVEKIRSEARAEAEKEITRDRVLDKIEAKAGGRVAAGLDAADVAALVLRRHDVDDLLDENGKPDGDAIKDAIDELLEAMPALAAGAAASGDGKAGGRGGRFGGGADGGASRKSRPQQLTQADLAKMTDEQIVKAEKEGRLADLYAGKG